MKLFVPVVLLACLQSLAMSQDIYPLDASAGNTTATEFTAPYSLPEGFEQTFVTRRFDIPNLPGGFGAWDMIEVSDDGRYIFIPAETGRAAGIVRYDLQTQSAVTLFIGNGSGARNGDPTTWTAGSDDMSRFDPCSMTPAGTIITGEESTGGRLFEILNPLAASGFQSRWLSNVPAVAHEGLRFDRDGTLYFVDENRSGSIYKFVPTVPGDLSAGQSFVLSVNDYAGDPTNNWNHFSNQGSIRTGLATWLPITDVAGNALTTTDPFVFVTSTGGRSAADELVATPYGRPEDLAINVLASGNECLYFTATSEARVYSVELYGGDQAEVRVFCSNDTINLATGAPLSAASTPRINSPDNLDVDAWGSVYVIEDQNPGDIWKAVDADKDGVAEGVGLWASLGVQGSEPTGLRRDPTDPYRFYTCTQHPSSGNDAIFAIDTRPYPGTDEDLRLTAGKNGAAPTDGPGDFIQDLQAGDLLNLTLTSPNSTFVGAPMVLAVQAFAPGAVLTSPQAGVHIDIAQPFSLVFDPAVAGAPTLGGGGLSLFTRVPVSLSGSFVRVQAGVVASAAANGSLAMTNAFDFRVN